MLFRSERERERETERQTDRETERQRDLSLCIFCSLCLPLSVSLSLSLWPTRSASNPPAAASALESRAVIEHVCAQRGPEPPCWRQGSPRARGHVEKHGGGAAATAACVSQSDGEEKGSRMRLIESRARAVVLYHAQSACVCVCALSFC